LLNTLDIWIVVELSIGGSASCGSGVINGSEADPRIAIVLVGTLDNLSRFNPTVELFCGRAQAWLRLAGQRQRFPGMPA
jgi:hypothetical protein